jgi:hypothetical protein
VQEQEQRVGVAGGERHRRRVFVKLGRIGTSSRERVETAERGLARVDRDTQAGR